jgi:transcriptional regulator with XRE-family HTH domain
MNRFSKNLFFLRKKFRITQTELASALGKGQSTIGNWESGEYKPTMEDLIKIGEYFAVSLDILVFEEIERRNMIRENDLAVFRTKSDLISGASGYLENPDEPSGIMILKQLKKMDRKLDLLLTALKGLKAGK